MPKISKARLMCLFSIAVLLAGCSPSTPQYLAGNLNGRNHTASAINYFTVSGHRGRNIPPYGYGGGACCVMLPNKWQPGLVVQVEWETDPDPYADSPPLGTDEFRAFMVEHESKYKKHRMIAEVPPYEIETLCSLKIHFLPCHTIKATTACPGYGQPGYPIKEPRVMEEPAVCLK